ncbi:Serpentine Receptor, class U [Caenorhabditis elegans]|uniref:Serpentine Receptor, class U n=1 Tax=Caenorhabditis elegans TaxID=6239 RepID=O45729_CAEEL|nr:Serpentine Receptor, class U [Caenorhabditis elegans]CAB05908.1 Serpentine Receptor, class U [Caenorhabditis elegans]|eukprot:NP_503103.1 Serpentine Receptor, class U [Caenorhabditis elegans]
MNATTEDSIHGDPRYVNYKFDPFTFPFLVAFIPLIYLIPTVFVIMFILKVFIRRLLTKKHDLMNPHVFLVIVLSQVTNFGYTLADYFVIRAPSTGIMTSWCASQKPNHFLKIIFFFSIYFNYTAFLFPLLLSVLRLIPFNYPTRQKQLCSKVVEFSIPFIFLYPCIFTFTLNPALGLCRQYNVLYQFGHIYVFFINNWFNVKLDNFLVPNAIFWLFLCTITNVISYRKMKVLRNKQKSKKLQRAERSLTLTTVSMLSAHINNLIFVMIYMFYFSVSAYLAALRPFGNNFDIVFSTMIFYSTHPVFKKRATTNAFFNVRALNL